MWKKVKDVSGGNTRRAWIKNNEQVVMFYPLNEKTNNIFQIEGHGVFGKKAYKKEKVYAVRTPEQYLVNFKKKHSAIAFAKKYMRTH